MVVRLDFKTDDTNLNLEGTVTFRRNVTVERLSIKGLAEWRNVPANIIHLSQDTIENLNVLNYKKQLAKVGVNFIGIKARSNILIAHTTRAGQRSGLQKTQDLLTKFFKAIGAQSVRFNIVETSETDYDSF